MTFSCIVDELSVNVFENTPDIISSTIWTISSLTSLSVACTSEKLQCVHGAQLTSRNKRQLLRLRIA